jgi:hypothetical protein
MLGTSVEQVTHMNGQAQLLVRVVLYVFTIHSLATRSSFLSQAISRRLAMQWWLNL